MKPISWSFIDRKEWRRGPWDLEEEDKRVWKDPETGLLCMIHRNHTGAWCGYVGFESTHRYHKVHYSKIGASVHGGLTFSSSCGGMEPNGRGICHPSDDDQDHVWWVGFDCNHLSDASPLYSRTWTRCESKYKTQEFVMQEVKKLALQLL